jgi:hypothetical protein
MSQFTAFLSKVNLHSKSLINLKIFKKLSKFSNKFEVV